MTSHSHRVWIKICGIRDVETAVRIAELGADAIGLNFYDRSPRHVADLAGAREIVAALPETTTPVGVFVNHAAEEIREICRATGLAAVQLHGDEPESLVGELAGYRIIRAIRSGGEFASEADGLLARYAALGVSPDAWLIDARVAGLYGGTGRTLDWSTLRPEHRENWLPIILAGGLTPANVAEAIAVVRPFGVDVASGVELASGVKDLVLVERFIAACRE